MDGFERIFNEAMELSCLGLFEKSQMSSEKGEYKQSKLLKKALDKFSLLNITCQPADNKNESMFPSDETALIKTFNFPVMNLINKLPEELRSLLKDSEWQYYDNLVNTGTDNCYYCTEELNEKINDDSAYRKASNAPKKELEFQSQKFIRLLFLRTQEEYCEIRSFFEDKRHVYITNKMFLEDDSIKAFKDKYPEIFEAAYEKLSYGKTTLKLCKHCGLVLREMSDGSKYCVSERCSQKSDSFSRYDEAFIDDSGIWVLKMNVACYIYYPGVLEQAIRKVLDKVGITYDLWPDMDTYDFKFSYQGKIYVVDVKDIKNPRFIQQDIMDKQEKEIPYDKVIYVVPSDTVGTYLRAVNRVIKDRNKISCVKITEFKKILEEGQQL